jgi:hypothetical protein
MGTTFRTVRSTLALATLLAFVVGAGEAQAQLGFTSQSIGKNAGNTTDFFQDDLTLGRQRTTTVGFTSIGGLQLRSRYAEVVGADAGAFASGSLTQNSDYTMSFTVVAPGAYDLNITTSLNGAFTIVDDGDGPASADASAVDGTCSGGTLFSGTVDLTDPGSRGSAGNTAFLRTSSAVVRGTSNGVSQAHSLRFTWSASCSSSNGFLTGGDECAVRLGLPVTYGARAPATTRVRAAACRATMATS